MRYESRQRNPSVCLALLINLDTGLCASGFVHGHIRKFLFPEPLVVRPFSGNVNHTLLFDHGLLLGVDAMPAAPGRFKLRVTVQTV